MNLSQYTLTTLPFGALFFAGHERQQFQPAAVPKPCWPLGTICCGPLSDASGALCGACTEPKPGKCKYRGKPGHLAELPRCGIKLLPPDCERLTVCDAGGSIVLKYVHRDCLSATPQISVNKANEDYMLQHVGWPARTLFNSSVITWHKEWTRNKSVAGGGGGGEGGGSV